MPVCSERKHGNKLVDIGVETVRLKMLIFGLVLAPMVLDPKWLQKQIRLSIETARVLCLVVKVRSTGRAGLPGLECQSLPQPEQEPRNNYQLPAMIQL